MELAQRGTLLKAPNVLLRPSLSTIAADGACGLVATRQFLLLSSLRLIAGTSLCRRRQRAWKESFATRAVFQYRAHSSNRKPGSIDAKAGSEHGTAHLMIGRKIGTQGEIFARGWYLDDRRQNGTPDETNNIRLGEAALGALTLRFYGDAQAYNQGFSSVATNRNSEIRTDLQAVPAQGVGGSAVWARALGERQTLVGRI
jgi:hypothetical protein